LSLDLLNLDDRSYEDLVAEARSLIPSLAPEWTDWNPSDPGITLVELFAWLTEMLLYRANRLPEKNVRTFLRLLNGSAWTPGADLEEDIRATVLDLRKRHRAVTTADYELLAREASPEVARAHAVPRRDLSALTEAARTAPRPGYVSVLVVPARATVEDPPISAMSLPLPADALLAAVEAYLDPRRLVTVRNVISGPIYTPVEPRIVLARRPEADPEDLRRRAVAALRVFLDPLVGGGTDGALPAVGGGGWPFGRDVYVSQIYQILEALPGVDYVPDVFLTSTWPGTLGDIPQGHGAAATPLWHDSGDLIGLGLEAHHLPWMRLDPQASPYPIAVGSAFVPVQVAVAARLGTALAPALARRAIKAQVRSLFHPLEGGPAEDPLAKRQPLTITAKQVQDRILALPDVAGVDRLTLDAPPDRRTPSGVQLLPGELFDVSVTVTLS
jgi:hypothetical protein